MATVAAAAIIPALNLGNTLGAALVGAGIYAAAGYLDSRLIIPGLTGSGREQGQSPRLLGLPVGPNEAGAPRVFAIGKTVRVPAHILFQSSKARTQPVGGGSTFKSGTSVPQRHVYIDAAIAVNDRKTKRVRQVVGNGKLMIFESRNLVIVTTPDMSYDVQSGRLVVQMADTSQPDFADRFAVNDFVQMDGFAVTGGASPNGTAWRVMAVVAHTFARPSYLELVSADNVTLSGMTGTGGSAASPAKVTRIDDALIVDPSDITIQAPAGGVGDLRVGGFYVSDVANVFAIGDEVFFEDSTSVFLPGNTGYRQGPMQVVGFNFPSTVRLASAQSPRTPAPEIAGKFPRIVYTTQQFSAAGILPSGYIPSEHFFDGSEDQGECPTIVAELGTGNVPAYRGVAFLELFDMDITIFGDSLPFQLEALIDVDEGMTWQEALTICCERGGVDRDFVDTGDVTPAPFEGYFMRGAIPGVSNLFPLLLAGQITTQERDGTLCFQDTDRADVVAIEHGTTFSDFGSFVGQRPQDDRWKFAHAAREDLPTSIGIRHQDPDNLYADGYQHFGLRNPSAAEHENRQELDLSNLVLTRKQARNLAATYMRRAWINSTSVEFTLPAAYCDLLEGDLVTWTDDDGRDFVARIIQRDIGTNFLVRCKCVLEQLDLAVTGSPVQSAAGATPPTLPQPPSVVGALLDIGPLVDADAYVPTLYGFACGTQGSLWAGCAVYVSTDSEATWSLAGTIGAEQGIIGTVLDPEVPGFQAAEDPDTGAITWQDAVADSGVLVVEFENTTSSFPLGPMLPSDVLQNRLNWFAVTHEDGAVEVIAAELIDVSAGNVYVLQNLLRGLRGTWQQATRPIKAGARIVRITDILLGLSGVRIQLPGLTTPRHVSVRFVPPGRDLADVQSVSVFADWRSVSPFDIRDLSKTYDGLTGDVKFEAAHWTRLNLPLGSTGPYPLDETFEEYQFTVWDPSGNHEVRNWTVSSRGTGSPTLRDRFVVYTAAEQTADGYTPGPSETFWVSVRQVGDYGRSRPVRQEL